MAIIPQLGQQLGRKLDGMSGPRLVPRVSVHDGRNDVVLRRETQLRRADAHDARALGVADEGEFGGGAGRDAGVDVAGYVCGAFFGAGALV
jgi:hypothetical protein